jgi:GNAT superfamily N-acetyltransferase
VAIGNATILGYVTVTPSEVQIDDVPLERRRRLPRYPLPVLRLARLAVNRDFHRVGLGRALLRFVFRLAHRMAGEVGCTGVLVDAKPKAVDCCARYGLEPVTALEGALTIRPQPVPMFLPLTAIPAE